MSLAIDRDLLKRFEEGLDTLHPERSAIPASILGYGEISTVFRLAHAGQDDIAYKRMPIFDTQEQVEHYLTIYRDYNDILKRAGLTIPDHDAVSIRTQNKGFVVYAAQQRLVPESIGNKVIHLVSDAGTARLLLAVLEHLKKVWDFNAAHRDTRIGIDGQISNWALQQFDPANPQVGEHPALYYIDTSTPMIRKNGTEMLEADLFLKSAPSFLRWMVRWFFLQDVLDRYYDFRLVVIDLIANFHKEGRPDQIPGLIRIANEFCAHEARDYGIKPIEPKEVESYYKQDAFIWRLFLALRKFDRFLKTRVFRGRYAFILPGTIRR